MIKLSRGAKICSIISIILIVLALVLLRPLNNKLESIVSDYARQLNQILYEKAGVSVSYKTFSPSILASFKISDIKCVDRNLDEVVVIEELDVNYKLFNAISGKYSDIVKTVKIDGIKVDLGRLLDIIFEAIDNSKNPEEEPAEKIQDSQLQEEFVFDFKPIADFIPADCKIRDLTLIYNNTHIDSTYFVDEVSLSNFKNKELIDVLVQGRMELLVKAINLNVDGDIFVAGSVTHKLDDSTAKITASNFDVYGYKISKQNLLASYKNYEVEAHSIQTVNPLYIWGMYNFKEMFTRAGFKTDNLAPMTVFSTKDKQLEEMVKDFRLSVDASMEYRIPEDKMVYDSNGFVYVPNKYVPKGLNVNYDVYGDFNHLMVNKLNATGSLCDVKSNFDFIYSGLKLDGVFDIQRFSLPNGNSVRSKVYVNPLSKGFMIFSPEVNIGNKTLTGIESKVIPQTDSIDFEFEVSDFKTLEEPENDENANDLHALMGKIEIDGSYLMSSNYAQANVSLNSLSIQSILEYVQEVVPQSIRDSLEGAIDFTQPYVFSGDMYVSSDLKSISYNIPYVIFANVQEDNQYIFASANGNEQSVQLNRFDLIFGSYAVNLTGSLDIAPETNDMFFDVELIAASIPYHLTGNIDSNRVSIRGDYGIDAFVNFNKDKIDGTLSIASLPFMINTNSFILSTDALFEYNSESGPQIQVAKLEVEKYDINASISPKITLAGSGTKYGAQLSSIIYSDKYSVLDGSADIKVNINDGIFNSAAINMIVLNDSTKEKIAVDISASNPDGLPLNVETLMKNMYLNANVDINNFAISRFTPVKNSNNTLTGSLSLTGTLEHPYAAVTLNNISLFFGSSSLTAKGDILLEDRLLSIINASVGYPTWGFSNLNGEIDLEKFEGQCNSLFFMGGKSKDLEMPLSLKIYDSFYNESQFIPDIFTVTLSTGEITGNLIKHPAQFELSMNYSPDFISIFSSDNLGLVGTYIPETGEIFGSLDSFGIVSFDVGGIISLTHLDGNLSRIKVDLKQLLSYLNLEDMFKLDSGMLEGELKLGGSLDEPDINGVLSIVSPKFRVPMVFDQPLSTDVITITAEGNEIILQPFNCAVKNTQRFSANGKIVLDKWSLDTIYFNLKTLNKQIIPIRFKNNVCKFDGDLTTDIGVIYERNIWNVTGNIFADDVDFIINIPGLATSGGGEKEEVAVQNAQNNQNAQNVQNESSLSLRTNIKLRFGTHVSINFKPILRAIFAPNTNFALKIDTDSSKYEVDGELRLRSGDIAYLQRNFYIKEGNIKFNPNDLTNPVITLRAETREKDSLGQQVKIIFAVENQNLKNLNPKFSSVPSKSEQEIMSLLGQVMKTDSDNIGEVLLSVGDYYIQSTVMSGIENKLRDLFNFDIFSVRTNFLQNTFGTLNSNGTSSDEVSSEKQKITIGNFLDNSTVYIGKYLGSALYVDGMLHLSLEDSDSTDITSAGNLIFRPEIGLELELPIANIRWNMAPDINALMNNQYVPSTSLTLSWKFNF